jgi:hypothetical protein
MLVSTKLKLINHILRHFIDWRALTSLSHQGNLRVKEFSNHCYGTDFISDWKKPWFCGLKSALVPAVDYEDDGR